MKALNAVVYFLWKSVVPVYRVAAISTLYLIVFCMIGYASMVVFFLTSDSWAVPFVINSSDDKVLALTNQLTLSFQSVNAAQLDKARALDILAVSQVQRGQLARLDRQLNATINDQKHVGNASAHDLETLKTEKSSDNAVLTKDKGYGKELRAIIEQDLASGMITKGDADTQIMQLDQFASGATDSRISETLMLDGIRQHFMMDTNSAAILAQKVQLETQIETLDSTIRVAIKQIKTDDDTIHQIQAAAETAKKSPYYEAVNSTQKLNLAVAPYSKRPVKIGSPIYNCWLGMAVCFQVGKVTEVLRNEEIFEQPILRINMRGYLVKMELTEEAAKSKTLVIGTKPLLF